MKRVIVTTLLSFATLAASAQTSIETLIEQAKAEPGNPTQLYFYQAPMSKGIEAFQTALEPQVSDLQSFEATPVTGALQNRYNYHYKLQTYKGQMMEADSVKIDVVYSDLGNIAKVGAVFFSAKDESDMIAIRPVHKYKLHSTAPEVWSNDDESITVTLDLATDQVHVTILNPTEIELFNALTATE